VAGWTNLHPVRGRHSPRGRAGQVRQNLGRPDPAPTCGTIEVRTLTTRRTFTPPSPLRFAPDGSTLAMVSGKEAIRLIAVATGEERLRLPIPGRGRAMYRLSADGNN